VDDGIYGTFNTVLYDHAAPSPSPRPVVPRDGDTMPTAVFGPTCDGLDQLCSSDTLRLPRCDIDDWLIWPDQGAYAHTASFVFNGYTHVPARIYVTDS
jgi:diaminopimelate decarboxylase